jgi:hypothetical protein
MEKLTKPGPQPASEMGCFVTIETNPLFYLSPYQSSSYLLKICPKIFEVIGSLEYSLQQ